MRGLTYIWRDDVDTLKEKKGSKHIACPQHCDLSFPGPPSGLKSSGGVRTRNRRVPAYLRAYSLSTVPPTPPEKGSSL
ncbi:hypothetical protein PoB_006206400 [Plakobranchus ocellatus]|uniref:Uncharacterized protein n=1 Tax=Plakobranchus ocellatus TaxID=259542 RepID=A0AAV4CUK2_9GAST|nr:hypothetical protein PoB_006206400 [Plakobranchus ocellatus]